MKLNSLTKIFSWYFYIVIAVVFAVGIFASVFTYMAVSKSTQELLLKNAASIASVFDAKDIAFFTGSDADLKNSIYLDLKEQLEKIPQINDEVRFVYLWGFRNGQVYFLVDSEPANSTDYSPPGQIYNEATQVDRAMFLKNLPASMEMNTDRWGTWLSALIPIKDPNTGNLIAVMGMDMSASKYFKTIYAFTAIPIMTTIFVLLLIIIGIILRKHEKDFLTFKSELVSIASHEIRSPLTGMSWLIEGLLQDGNNLSQKQKENIGIIKKKSETLLRTINDLLDGAVADKLSRKKLAREPIAMRALFENIADESSLVLTEKNIKLNINASLSKEITIWGDVDRIKRMFNNLISNAIKYSGIGGTIMVNASMEGENVVFSIKDEGIGISKGDQNKIFKGFFRAENAQKVTENGTGLGLHYVRQIAELHGGRVWCESEERRGSTFFVELPKN